MRQVLVDYARSHSAEKRGGQKVELDIADAAVGPVQVNVLDVDHALKELEAIAPRQAQLVELRFFGGFSLEEAVEVLKMARGLLIKIGPWPGRGYAGGLAQGEYCSRFVSRLHLLCNSSSTSAKDSGLTVFG
jgi:hypothetical protein